TSGDILNIQNTKYQSVSSNIQLQSIHFVSADKRMFFDVPTIDIIGLDIQSLYQDGQFRLDSLIIERPIGINLPGEAAGQKQPFVTPIVANHIAVNNISWSYRDKKNEQDLNLNNGFLRVEKFESLDTLTLSTLTEKIGNLSFEAGPFEMSLSDDYRLLVDNYSFSYPNTALRLDDIQLIPSYTPMEYSNVIEKQNDWFNVKIDDVTVEGIDLSELITKQKYMANKMFINGVDALIYRDKGVPFPEDQVRNLPQQTIRNISHAFLIDTINVKGTIRYQEKPDDYFTHGEISFDELDASLINVGNANIAENEHMILSASGKLMEVGNFEVKGVFNMNAADEEFSLSGSIKEFPLDSMNQMLGPVANVNIKSGYATELYFNFKANDTLARGNMRFRYDDLKVQILNTKTHDTHGLGQGIKTFFANTFVVKSKNPSYLVFLRRGTIFQERDTSRAIFNYWGKALLSGAVSSVGVHKSDKAEKKFERNKVD
ncbi:MAG: hypothetical protein RLP12_07125, partial [Ekhidna sp.]